ncbi:MAG: Bacterial extracellular solute-binding protein [Clostridia bacterium]|nr:Bacterial extracellular solute-binding protein [Clostridia bacterium]
MKKIAALIFYVFLLFVICSCSGTAEEAELNETINTEIDLDFDGATFRFGSVWINEYLIDEGVSESGDKMNARYKEIEEKFNIKYELITTSESLIMQNTAAGLPESIPDFADISGNGAYGLYEKDILFPFDEITTMDAGSVKYGSHNFVNNGAEWGGHQWCIYPNNWQMVPQYSGLLVFNLELLQKNNIEKTPYEYLETNSWTWDNFEILLKQLTFTEGADKYFGLSVENISWFADSAVLSNGGSAVIKKPDGTYAFGYGEKEAVEALEWMANLKKSGYIYSTNGALQLSKGKIAFEYCQSYNATLPFEPYYPFTLPSYGIITFPWGPSGEYGVDCGAFVIFNRRFICCIATSENDKEQLGYIIEYLYEPLNGDEALSWQKKLKYNLQQEADIDNFLWMFNNVGYNFSGELTGAATLLNSAMTKIYNGKETVPAAVEAVASAANQSIIDYFN